MAVDRELRVKEVKTRKTRRCFGCLEIFPPDTKMMMRTNVGDGRIYDIYICEDCKDFMTENDDLCLDPWEDCYHEGCVREARSELLEGGGE